MSDLEGLPEADRVQGAPHPRETLALFGQEQAEASFLTAWAGSRLHHAWLLTGPRGVGKATLAWRLARALLARREPPDTLDADPADPLQRRLAALAESRLFLLRRAWDADTKRLKTVVTVDEVRRLRAFLALSATDGGRRVVIVDAADEMNASAANALLKSLEEPPGNTIFLLVAHNPGAVLATIRSRCRRLPLGPLDAPAMARALEAAGAAEGAADAQALGELAGGSVGEALRMAAADGVALYAELVELLRGAPRIERPALLALAAGAAGRAAEARYDLILRLTDLLVARLARQGAGHPPAAEAARGEADLLSRLAPTLGAGRRWAELQASLAARVRHARAVNLDPSALILDTVLKINETAAATSAR